MTEEINGNRVVRELKYHLTDSTALVSIMSPIYASVDVFIAKMSDELSIDAKLFGTGVTYAGVGYGIMRGNDFSRNFFGINEDTKEHLVKWHDRAYMAVTSGLVTPSIYFCSGSRDWKELGTMAIASSVIGGTTGGLAGYMKDTFRDLVGLKECNRESYPELVKRQNKKVKKGIAVGFVAASIGLLSLIYTASSDKIDWEIPGNGNTLEKVVEEVTGISF